MMVVPYGDWKALANTLQHAIRSLSTVNAKLYENGKLVVEQMQGHIDKQDLPWEQLSEITTRLKESEKIYVDTGEIRDNIGVFELKKSPKGNTIFVGASPWKTHEASGLKYSDLIMYLEYGTSTQPGRPLIEPTYNEMKGKLKSEWKAYLTKEILGR